MKISAILSVLLLFSAPAIAGEREDQAMDRIEQTVELPPGAAPLASYMRFYAWSKQGQTVWALYTLSLPAGRDWVARDAMPVMMASGCTIVIFDYNIKLNTPKNLRCG